jgi:acyl carrier protein
MSYGEAAGIVKSLILELQLPDRAEAKLSGSASLRTDLGISSLNLLILLVRIQEKTGIEFAAMPRPVISDIQTFGDLVSLVAKATETATS